MQVTNPSLDTQCYLYQITVGQSGLLNLTRIVFGLTSCPNLCTLLSTKLLDLNIPLNITGSVLNLPLIATGHIGVDASTGLCGIIVDVDLDPLDVNVLDLIKLNLCLDLSLVVDLGTLLNGLLGSVLGTVSVLLDSVTSSLGLNVPDLCTFAS